MSSPEMLDKILQLSIGDRWQLVESILNSIQAETLPSTAESSPINSTPESDRQSALKALEELREMTQNFPPVDAVEIARQSREELEQRGLI
ncbi:MAG: hypothetical protein J7545_04445 [Roseofilum sp. SBFL]|uniref:hypothetical protein n=1 Tax=unclassified Roseofilum TaxID=2620099 RepID=UPI001B166EEC|nr:MULTISPECIES: hypothetical protein [unclassified Roseofilum]MBP0013613.1 hypothetical protein [Roseofilum sp. SID3]MBP0026737.1 hypothetical protein [Roseofilum sp. SID2]MBP0039337.1 hypothetical protein [Roseofilum sp. SID1]MBP0041215.1 hypothetical protein [Roseofilum sp. SBFL]